MTTPVFRSSIPGPDQGVPDTKPRGTKPRGPNFVRIFRRPVYANTIAPCFIDLPDGIDLQDAIGEAMEFARRNNVHAPDHLVHDGKAYRFLLGQGVIQCSGNRQIGKVQNPHFDG